MSRSQVVRRRSTFKRNLLGWFVALTLVVSFVEVGAFFAGSILQSKWAMWRPPAQKYISAEEESVYERYLESRHPVVGWPMQFQHGRDLTTFGAHPDPFFLGARHKDACVSVYGDSFTEGGDISEPAMRWASQLSADLNCYVANFGMGGYGTDQAYLRFFEHTDQRPHVAILGVHTENVLRNLTRNRDLLSYERSFALKPRFILSEEGHLTLVPIPDISYDEYLRSVDVKKPFLPLMHESWQPEGPGGVVALRFPFALSLVKNSLRFHGFHARMSSTPDWKYYWEVDDELRGLDVTLAILDAFLSLAEDREIEPLLLILPHPEDFEYYARTQVWPHQHLLKRLERSGAPYADFGSHLIRSSGETGVSLAEYFGPTGHYNDRGNRLLADFVRTALTDRFELGRPQVLLN